MGERDFIIENDRVSFILVPNDSLEAWNCNNRFLLGLWLYIKYAKNRMQYIDTTPSMIADFFYRGYSNKKDKIDQFIDAMKLFKDAGLISFRTSTNLSNVKANDTLEIFDEHFVDLGSNSTIIGMHELEYLITFVDWYNVSSKSKIDSLTMLGIYLYIKGWCCYFRSKAKQTYMGYDTIGLRVGCGPNTVRKYVSLLVDAKMLTRKVGSFSKGTSTVFDFTFEWEDYYDDMYVLKVDDVANLAKEIANNTVVAEVKSSKKGIKKTDSLPSDGDGPLVKTVKKYGRLGMGIAEKDVSFFYSIPHYHVESSAYH